MINNKQYCLSQSNVNIDILAVKKHYLVELFVMFIALSLLYNIDQQPLRNFFFFFDFRWSNLKLLILYTCMLIKWNISGLHLSNFKGHVHLCCSYCKCSTMIIILQFEKYNKRIHRFFFAILNIESISCWHVCFFSIFSGLWKPYIRLVEYYNYDHIFIPNFIFNHAIK